MNKRKRPMRHLPKSGGTGEYEDLSFNQTLVRIDILVFQIQKGRITIPPVI